MERSAAHERDDRLGLLAIGLQLALIVWVALRFNFESPSFQSALPYIAAGFVVHHFLPRPMRLGFFVLISIATLGYVLGDRPAGFDWSIALTQGGALFSISLALIGVCHLPIAFRARIALLTLAGAALVVLRGGPLAKGELGPVWPLLGSMFMFRMILYAYQRKSESSPPSFTQSMAYFFMLPNAFFPLFPVVDWKTFRTQHFSGDALRIYQTGLNWMARGLLHVAAYRLIYYHYYIDASLVADGQSLLKFVLTNYALYLHVSGQYHMIVGVLHLFGFDLPPINHQYFLAESFTDYWRRVNIYWKDFMVAVFYMPTAFALRRHGSVLPAVVGSAAAFVATWLLHAYQSYWLRGAVSFSATDSLFWAVLGACVMWGVARETRRRRKRSLSTTIDWKASASACLRTMGMFAMLSSLWSLWASPSIATWLGLWRFADAHFFALAAATLLAVGVAKLAFERVNLFRGGVLLGNLPGGAGARAVYTTGALACIAPVMLLALVSEPRVQRRVDDRTRFVLSSLTRNKPNTLDLRAMERGYYEDILDASGGNVLDTGVLAPADWVDFPKMDILRKTKDQRYWELTPSQRRNYNGYALSTNALGLRDREYARVKPSDTYRAAILGSSYVMGWCARDGEPFEARVEESLEHQRSDGKRLEILNFGLGGYSPVCQLGVLRERALPLGIDAIYYIGHSVDGALAMERLARLVAIETPLEDDFLKDIVARAKLSPRMSQLAMLRELRPYENELLRRSYEATVALARSAGATPVWLYLPRVSEVPDPPGRAKQVALAAGAGFVTFDMADVWGELDADEVGVAPWDLHPNAEGHRLIGERMVKALRSDPQLGFR